MAQQTQAARAADAWSRFMALYPTPAALASAPLANVLRAWRGLGYNRRAVSLQRAAIAIVGDHGGVVPSDLDALDRLPGVGSYTARAVAALAFGRRVGAVDTNVRRVLTRAFLDHPSGSPADPASLQALADQLAPPTAPGTWTHALMDVGATVCRVRSPRCADCPLAFACAWAAGRPASVAAGRARRERPFTSTSRWLRGRILDRLRDLDDGSWLAFGEAIGTHDTVAVAAALESLRRDGLVELRGTAPPEARLPHA